MTYSIQQIKTSDCKEILLSLWEKNFDSANENRYDWIYRNNPEGKATCFFLKYDRDGSTVGAISLFPRTIFVDGQKVSGFICGDFTVDKAHRALGPAVKLLKAAINKCEQDAPCILLGFPNKASQPVMQRAGFEILNDRFEMTQVLNLSPYLRRYVDAPVAAGAISFILSPLLRMREGSTTRKKKGRVSNFTEHFNASFEKSFFSLKNRYSLIGFRGFEYMQWRFGDYPHGSHQVFTLEPEKANGTKSYIIYSSAGLKRTKIDDIFVSEKKSLKVMLKAFADYQRLQGSDAVTLTFSGSDEMVHSLQKCGYSIRSHEEKAVIYTSGNNEFVEKVKSGNWYLTSADNDINI